MDSIKLSNLFLNIDGVLVVGKILATLKGALIWYILLALGERAAMVAGYQPATLNGLAHIVCLEHFERDLFGHLGLDFTLDGSCMMGKV